MNAALPTAARRHAAPTPLRRIADRAAPWIVVAAVLVLSAALATAADPPDAPRLTVAACCPAAAVAL